MDRSRQVAFPRLRALAWIMAGSLAACVQLPALGQTERNESTALPGGSLREFAAVMPERTPIRNIHFPRFDETGKLRAIVDAAMMMKLDDNTFALKQLSIRLVDAEGQPETHITNPLAFYDWPRGLLFSIAETQIAQTKPPGTINGKGLVFDLERRVGRLFRDTEATFKIAPDQFQNRRADSSNEPSTAKPVSLLEPPK